MDRRMTAPGAGTSKAGRYKLNLVLLSVACGILTALLCGFPSIGTLLRVAGWLFAAIILVLVLWLAISFITCTGEFFSWDWQRGRLRRQPPTEDPFGELQIHIAYRFAELLSSYGEDFSKSRRETALISNAIDRICHLIENRAT